MSTPTQGANVFDPVRLTRLAMLGSAACRRAFEVNEAECRRSTRVRVVEILRDRHQGLSSPSPASTQMTVRSSIWQREANAKAGASDSAFWRRNRAE